MARVMAATGKLGEYRALDKAHASRPVLLRITGRTATSTPDQARSGPARRQPARAEVPRDLISASC
jgi:hypothetical protein